MASVPHRNAANLVALTCIQISNALIPVIIFPFALTVLGAEAYAELAVAEAISILVLTAVLFSFEVDGVAKLVGLDPHANHAALTDAVWSITAARLLLFLLAATFVLASYAAATREAPVLLALWLLVPLGHVFFSYWAWQALESNAIPAALTLAGRVASLCAVVILVDAPEDQALIPLLVGAPFAAAGLISFFCLCVRFRIRPRRPQRSAIAALLRNGRAIFGGNVAVMLYRETNVLLLGIVGVGAAALSAYSLAEKAVKMIQAASRPLSQLFFPKLLRALGDADAPAPGPARTIWRYTLPQLAMVAALLTLLVPAYLIAPQLSDRIGELVAMPGIALMLVIMAPATLLGIANFTFGTAGLNRLGARGYLFRSILITGVASAAACLLLSAVMSAVGAALCFTAAEALLLILILRAYFRPLPSQELPKPGHQRHA